MIKRFGKKSLLDIEECVSKSVPANTTKSHSSVWTQFENFCADRNYILQASTSPEEVSNMLMDYAFNMKKVDGSGYKEACIKTMWNVTAKLVQEKFFKEFGVSLNPFQDLCFKKARDARDSKRRELQEQVEKRKISSTALTEAELMEIKKLYSEENPEGLQKKFFFLASYELIWRGGEAANCLVKYFKPEIDNTGRATGRIEYNPIFSKTAQGGNQRLEDSKWLTKNEHDSSMCPVRIFNLLLSKRSSKITSERLFLTVNPYWKKSTSSAWFKNLPVGRNEISKWTRTAAEKIGIDTKKVKITNHSTRSTAVSHLVKAGVSENELIKISGHKNTSSIKPYLKLDENHHKQLVNHMQGRSTEPKKIVNNSLEAAIHNSVNEDERIVYNNCVFNFSSCEVNFNKNTVQ